MTEPGPLPEPDEPCPDADRLAALDDRLVGRGSAADDRTEAVSGAVDPAKVDLLLLLNQVGAEYRDRREAVADQPALPATLGRFSVVREVGRGGFATVHEAIDRQLRRRVALKIARPECLVAPSLLLRIVREAELAARLSHPHLVPVHEVGESDGFVYIAEDFCDAASLAEWLAAHPGLVDAVTAARVTRALADAVATVHAHGISHRDIKPANVLLVTTAADGILPALSGDAGGLTGKLGDFGLGKLADDCNQDSPLTALTRAGSRVPGWVPRGCFRSSLSTPPEIRPDPATAATWPRRPRTSPITSCRPRGRSRSRGCRTRDSRGVRPRRSPARAARQLIHRLPDGSAVAPVQP